MKEILRPLHRIYRWVFQGILGSTHGPHFIWMEQSRKLIMKLLGPPIKKINHYPQEIKYLTENGFVSIPSFLERDQILRLKKDYNKIISQDEKTFHHSNHMALTCSMDEVSKVWNGILNHPRLKNFLTCFYGSYYKLHFFTGGRNFYLPKEDRQDLEKVISARWHMDNHTADLVRLLINLQDTSDKNGPTHVIGKKRTRQLMRMGFYTRNDYKISDQQMNDECYVNTFNGPMETAHFLMPGKCLHRAGIPEISHFRDMLIVSFRPGLEKNLVAQLDPARKFMYNFSEKLTEDFVSPPMIKKFGKVRLFQDEILYLTPT